MEANVPNMILVQVGLGLVIVHLVTVVTSVPIKINNGKNNLKICEKN